MVPFIEKVMDVISDGNCGFRVITEFLGLTEESHIIVRIHLIQELKEMIMWGYMRVMIIITVEAKSLINFKDNKL